MNSQQRPTAETIRKAREQDPTSRERDFAAGLGISEAEYAAAYSGTGTTRISADINALLPELGALGTVLALTRNESAVHEKVGAYENPRAGKHASVVLGEDIDLRIFPGRFVHGFAVEKKGEDAEVRRSLQFFDAHGDAVHKIHLRPESDADAWLALVERHRLADQSPDLPPMAAREKSEAAKVRQPAGRDELRARWEAMTDVHQFFGILRSLELTRQEAFDLAGDDLAWRIQPGAIGSLISSAAGSGLPIMCFVGNDGCIQIHSGPVTNIREMGPWINVMDPGFHLHLRQDHIRHAWVVRKPNRDGRVTSVEAYDAEGRMIIQFFGKRKEGQGERAEWRELAEGLPRLPTSRAA
jgi:putative hemin transport protein